MRKFQKQQIEDFIHLLNEAHTSVKKALHSNEKAAALSLLAQCQEGAVSLGTLIESIEGEGFPAVTLLEDYCEEVYQCSESVRREDTAMSGNRVYKILSKKICSVEESVKRNLRLRLEVAFFPYKASMWDSLESVWRAADADPDCDAYVVPIPYYDKNPDGSFNRVYYEGGQYPEGVPIVWYEDYDFAKRRPDIIFVHNCYDDCNLVTSVDPRFYTKNLKQYTEQLVYIPYFVLNEIPLCDQSAIKNIDHFCIIPGVLWADKVIVQSENMRRIYINVLSEYTGEQNRPHWEKTILGMGSPKFDKVESTGKEGMDIPADWLRILQKPDGSWKKVVFYNTGVARLLEKGDQTLRQIEDVFDLFCDRQKDLAFLWRPHPLMESTLLSMRPGLWADYKKLKDAYIADGWGIYDDTSDLNRAIALSDIYYGPPSSVAELFRKAKKPVLVL